MVVIVSGVSAAPVVVELKQVAVCPPPPSQGGGRQLGGFGASAKQSIGRGMMAKQISAIFEKARAGFKGQ